MVSKNINFKLDILLIPKANGIIVLTPYIKRKAIINPASYFSNNLIMKILDHKRIEEERLKQIRIHKAKSFRIHLELNQVYHYMWNKYEEFKYKRYNDFINEDFTIRWHLTAIKNLRQYETDSDDYYTEDENSEDDY